MTEPVSSNRIVLSVKKSADGKAYTTAWEGKTYLASSPLALDQKLDKADVPRPRIFKVVPA